MQLRITRELPPRFNGFDTAHLQLGHTYEIGETLGAWLLAFGFTARIGPLIAEHREELEPMGWTLRLVDGAAHDLGFQPDVVVPLVREFLDPLLLRG